MTDAESARPVLEAAWRDLTGDEAAPVDLRGTAALPGAFRVADAAVAAVGCGLLAAARWCGARSVALDVEDAVGVFLAERRVLVDGVAPALWDPLAGDHLARDGWVRLHTNYRAHRQATLRALALPPDADRAAVSAAVAERSATDVEELVAAAGAAAAALRSREQWWAHPQSEAVARRRLVEVTVGAAAWPAASGASGVVGLTPDGPRTASAGDPPRVLDLTRVIAGPTATKVLAAIGADVLRLDAPGFEELPALVADTSAGKRCAQLDLHDGRVESLVAAADVLVCGLRPGALARLGWPPERLARVNPGLVVAELSAYGDTGPWAGRRGFDSLVQTVNGMAAEGMHRADAQVPVPLPAQALDHASGWLLAAGVLHALTLRRNDGRGRHVSVVLARTGTWLDDLGRQDEPAFTAVPGEVEVVRSSLGGVTRVVCPGALDGRRLRWAGPPSALGSAEPVFG